MKNTDPLSVAPRCGFCILAAPSASNLAKAAATLAHDFGVPVEFNIDIDQTIATHPYNPNSIKILVIDDRRNAWFSQHVTARSEAATDAGFELVFLESPQDASNQQRLVLFFQVLLAMGICVVVPPIALIADPD